LPSIWTVSFCAPSALARRPRAFEEARSAAFGGTKLTPVVSFLVWRAVVAGGPQLSFIR
jgi:hypothetical protein